MEAKKKKNPPKKADILDENCVPESKHSEKPRGMSTLSDYLYTTEGDVCGGWSKL